LCEWPPQRTSCDTRLVDRFSKLRRRFADPRNMTHTVISELPIDLLPRRSHQFRGFPFRAVQHRSLFYLLQFTCQFALNVSLRGYPSSAPSRRTATSSAPGHFQPSATSFGSVFRISDISNVKSDQLWATLAAIVVQVRSIRSP